jgi:hypothetical protein
MVAGFTDENRVTTPVREIEQRGEAQRFTRVRRTRSRNRRPAKSRDTGHDWIFSVADRAA